MAILVVSTVLFSLGAYGVVTRRNTINVLMCIEIMFNAGILNLAYFSRSGLLPAMSDQVFAAMVIAVAAAETAVGLALALAVFRRFGSIVTDDIDLMRG